MLRWFLEASKAGDHRSFRNARHSGDLGQNSIRRRVAVATHSHRMAIMNAIASVIIWFAILTPPVIVLAKWCHWHTPQAAAIAAVVDD